MLYDFCHVLLQIIALCLWCNILKLVIMNRLDKQSNRTANKAIFIVLLIMAVCFCLVFNANASSPFAGKTKHKTVKRMTKRQVKKAQKGKTFYYRKHRKIVKR